MRQSKGESMTNKEETLLKFEIASRLFRIGKISAEKMFSYRLDYDETRNWERIKVQA
tara:strand:- start:815 stop:985 length:171 start_codon:yes stop_codon:yes gene_type:complete